jgi:predicted Zn-dependent protease
LAEGGEAVDLKLMRAAALLDGDPAAAAREAAQILKSNPGHPTAMLLLATARRASGDNHQALADLAELAAARPHSALMQLELGRTHAANGHPAVAMTALKHAVEMEPSLAEAWRELSSLYAASGDDEACDAAYGHFTRLANPERHLAEAAALLANRRFDAAESLLKRQLEQAPQDLSAMRMLAQIAGEREDFVEAERLLSECLKLAPGFSGARFQLAGILHSQQKAYPMLPLLERLLMLEPDNPHYGSLQASAYNLLGESERACQILSTLLARHPNDEVLWLSYGHVLRIADHLHDAIEAYRKSIALRPSFGEAWFSLANLKTFRFSAEDIAAMRAQTAREDLTRADRLQFEFALGKALEDARDFAASFTHYARGNALRRAEVLYDSAANTRFVQRTETLYTREFFADRAGSGCQAPDPIFIVGLPRAGSTLLEQILASHSQVEGTRELPDIPGFAIELGAIERPGEPPAFPQSVGRLSRAQLAELGERYLAQTLPNRTLGRARFIDKMPSNFFNIGLIHLILPNARIIDARRSPMDCCFANFKQHFQAGVWFSYSLQDIGRYYRDYVRLMTHFDGVLPGRVHRVQYERVVADIEGEVRRLLDYCGLPFEEKCLRFHETRRVVQTASSAQVRQPLYSDSIELWRNYDAWLDELKEALGDVAQQSPPASGDSIHNP